MDTVDRIFALMDTQNKKQWELAEEIGVKKQRVSEWQNRISLSYRKYLPEIAAALHTSVGYLLTGAEQENVSPAQSDKGDVEELLDALPPEKLLEVIEKASARLRQLNS